MNDPGDSSPSTSSVEPAPAEPEPPEWSAEALSVTIIEEGGDWGLFASREQAIRDAAAALAAHPRCQPAQGAEACIVLADDALLRALNHTYRGKDAPTNVLSFPFEDASGGAQPRHLGPGAAQPRHLGDVVLAAETLRNEAEGQGIPAVHHLQHLVVHGLLHLLGFDHETAEQAEVMEGLEVQILATLGVPDPYAAAEGL
jgi:probable rRNA maturation factor